MWDVFFDIHTKSKDPPRIISLVMHEPKFTKLTVISIERKGIERIFEYLRPCKRLLALYVTGNRIITRDLKHLHHISSLRKLDLSYNGIHFLPEVEQMKSLINLEYLLLHENQLVGWRQLENVTCLLKLRHLTLHGNPSAKVSGCREFLIEAMPQLWCLDEFIIMDFERKEVTQLIPPNTWKGRRAEELKRFRPFNAEASAWKGFAYREQGGGGQPKRNKMGIQVESISLEDQ